VGEQVKTGFRLAGGVILFCVSLFLLAYGLDAVWSDGHFVSSAWLGWVELSLAVALIPLTMHLWVQFFAGCVGFGFLKSVIVAIAGRDWFPPHLPFSRLEAAEMAVFFGVTFVWLARFAWTRPELPDRIAVAVYLFSLWPRNNSHFSVVQGGVGLIALFLAWAVSRWKGRNRTAAVALVFLVSAGMLTRITDRAGLPPKNPARSPVELRAVEGQPVIESVDMRNGNVHVEIPIRAARQKTAAPRPGD